MSATLVGTLTPNLSTKLHEVSIILAAASLSNLLEINLPE